MSAMLRHHDRSRFHVIAYSDRNSSDAWTKRVASQVDEFRDVGAITDDDLASILRQDQLAILLELNGHTGGRNRLSVINSRVAPLQLSFLGYPNTAGVDEIDYFVTDQFCDPTELSDRLHMEKLLGLKPGFLCFDPWVETLPHRDSPSVQRGSIIFGVFNNPAKASPTVMSAWAAILKRVPDSTMLIKYGGKFRSEWLKDMWRSRFGASGVSIDRLQFLGPEPTISKHYERLASVDVALDTFPYQGTTTTLESLAAGIPVLTMAGETYCRRASSAIMLRLGFAELVAELVADSVDDYVSRAVELSTNIDDLQNLRHRIQSTFPASAICDGREFVAELEATMRRLLEVQPRIVTCTGMPRSGSTWSYNVVRQLLESVDGKQNVTAQYREGAGGDEAIENALAASAHQVIKLHYPQQLTMNAIRNGGVWNIYTFRDPVTALASFREMFGGDIASAARRIDISLLAAEEWK